VRVLGCVKLKYTECPQSLEAGACGMRGICSPYDWTGRLDIMTGDTALARWSTRWQRMDARPSEAINLSFNQKSPDLQRGDGGAGAWHARHQRNGRCSVMDDGMDA
jgi:hypothetical protein